MNRPFYLSILAVAIAILNGACASMTYDGRHQYVLVRSQPPGAKILVDGQQVGVTPDFVQVRRKSHPQIEIATTNQTVPLQLESNYNWRGSFWLNFVFLYYAPIGWGVDYITGSCWRIADPPVVKLSETEHFYIPQQDLMAIAPPTADTLALSDGAAQIWEDTLKKEMGERDLLPYDQTVHDFAKHHFDFDEDPTRNDRYGLYHDLRLTQVFESTVDQKGDGEILLTGHAKNVFTGENGKEMTVRLPASDLNASPSESFARRNSSWLHLVPNTIGVDLTADDTEISTETGINYYAHPASNDTFFEKALFYLGDLDITTQNPPRNDGSSRFRFQILPNIFAKNERIGFPDFPDIANTTFHYVQVSAGLGAEAGWQKNVHYIYFNFVPMYGVQYLSWQQQNINESLTLGGFVLRSELGYRYFVTRHLSARIFSKSTTSLTPLWDTAIHRIAPGAPSITNAIDTSAGIAVAYTFDLGPELH